MFKFLPRQEFNSLGIKGKAKKKSLEITSSFWKFSGQAKAVIPLWSWTVLCSICLPIPFSWLSPASYTSRTSENTRRKWMLSGGESNVSSVLVFPSTAPFCFSLSLSTFILDSSSKFFSFFPFSDLHNSSDEHPPFYSLFSPFPVLLSLVTLHFSSSFHPSLSPPQC